MIAKTIGVTRTLFSVRHTTAAIAQVSRSSQMHGHARGLHRDLHPPARDKLRGIIQLHRVSEAFPY